MNRSILVKDVPPAAHYVALQDLDAPDWKLLGHDRSEVETEHPNSLWTPPSIAIPASYFCIGLLLSLPRAHIEFFPRVLHASDAQLATVLIVRSLPWSMKVAFGILPDNFPIRNLRFKPYMLLGFLLSSFFNLLLACYGNTLTIMQFTLLLLGAMIGLVLADVMSDALVAQRVLTKQEDYAGQVQSTVYLARALSEMLGYWGGAVLSNRAHWGFGLSMGQIFGCIALAPLVTVIPCIFMMKELPVARVVTWPQQCAQLWIMLQRRATWQPLCFLALFNSLLLNNAAWGNFLTVAYDFDAFQYGALAAIGSTVMLASLFLYRHWVMPNFQAPWRVVYLLTGTVIAGVSALNILLVFRLNEVIGVPAFWFAVGDKAVLSFAAGMQQLPIAIMLVQVCPPQQEGIAYALLTSMVNLAHAFANTISNMLLRIWPAELDDLRRGDYDGVWKLTLLTSAVSLVPLLFTTRLLPRGVEEQAAMRDDMSERGARIVSTLYAVGILWVISLSLLAIAQPCNVLVGGHGC